MYFLLFLLSSPFLALLSYQDLHYKLFKIIIIFKKLINSTYKGKELKYDHKDSLFKCSGGKGKFNIDGSVAGGPPEKSLKIYPYIIEDSKLIINFSGI